MDQTPGSGVAAASPAAAPRSPQPHPLSAGAVASSVASGAAAPAASGYSPMSNPFGERPPFRTSAGVAVRLSDADLPSPAPFTPPSARQQASSGGRGGAGSGVGGHYQYAPFGGGAAGDASPATPDSVLTPVASAGASNFLLSPGAATPSEFGVGGAPLTPGGSGAASTTRPAPPQPAAAAHPAMWQPQQPQQQPQQQQWQTQPAAEPSPSSWLTGAPAASPSEVTPTSFGARARASGGGDGAAALPSPSALALGEASPAAATGGGAPDSAASSGAGSDRFGPSASDLLRKAATKMRAQTAVCESSRLLVIRMGLVSCAGVALNMLAFHPLTPPRHPHPAQ